MSEKQNVDVIHTDSGVATTPRYRDLNTNVFAHLCEKNGGSPPKWVLPYAAAMDGIEKAAVVLKHARG